MRRWVANPPADEAAISAAEAVLGPLPEVYRQYLRRTNGGEGSLRETYLALWRAEDLVDRNEGYSARTQIPGLVLIGSDGGGEAFGLDIRVDPSPVVMAPFIVLDWCDAVVVSPDFGELWNDLDHGYFPSDALALSGDLGTALRLLAADLVAGRYDQLVADGRIGRLAPPDLQRVIEEYDCTLMPYSDAAWLHLLGKICVIDHEFEPGTTFVDVPLWSQEEGRSDLTMQVTAKKTEHGYQLLLTALLVP